MKLLKLALGKVAANGPEGNRVALVRLYVDADTGQIYALTPERRDELDPTWRRVDDGA